MPRYARFVRVRSEQSPTGDPWWQPVGLWQCWWGIGFLAVAAALAHWS